ncbi:formate dehydrogenase accessory sulfurtransferase FdhD [Microbacterium sp. bgisy189]|uniref:formate dehydrogenase accessory sulfurtransferase FdhD n=1 Tax=Microbacterium sp. bgisy189 TaxID=3413798 RepID=UPI003EBED28A
MGRITARTPVVRVRIGDGATRRADVLAVEEPLEIRLGGQPYVVTMRTPGHDVELAAGFLAAEGVITAAGDLAAAIHCGGPGTGGADNTYNVLDVTLGPGVEPPRRDRSFTVSSACGVCGKDSIDAVRTSSRYVLAGDDLEVDAALLATLPDRLRAEQTVFDKTGGLHAAALFDERGDLLVAREDVGRHNAVDKVIGWALSAGMLPLRRTVLQVSGRASFELVQKAAMAGIPLLSAVSAPSSLAVDLARATGMTLAGFVRGETLNLYSGAERVRVELESVRPQADPTRPSSPAPRA